MADYDDEDVIIVGDNLAATKPPAKSMRSTGRTVHQHAPPSPPSPALIDAHVRTSNGDSQYRQWYDAVPKPLHVSRFGLLRAADCKGALVLRGHRVRLRWDGGCDDDFSGSFIGGLTPVTTSSGLGATASAAATVLPFATHHASALPAAGSVALGRSSAVGPASAALGHLAAAAQSQQRRNNGFLPMGGVTGMRSGGSSAHGDQQPAPTYATQTHPNITGLLRRSLSVTSPMGGAVRTDGNVARAAGQPVPELRRSLSVNAHMHQQRPTAQAGSRPRQPQQRQQMNPVSDAEVSHFLPFFFK